MSLRHHPLGLVAALTIVLVCAPSHAIDSETLDDPVLQTRYVAISKELRCLVCQNQSIQDSNADLAKDLRRQVRGMLLAGRSDTEIYAYMTERYGDYVRYRPPWRINTLLLQLFPFIVGLLGVTLLWGTLKKHRSRQSVSTPDEAERDLSLPEDQP
ncbi:MAG: cytochrome c-type biogenesis protein [Pseudomonadota bacterium]